VLLPSELQFLISDRGIHFTAKVFKKVSENSQPSFLTDRCKHKIRSVALLENPAVSVS
jgi:hypothetical protein